MAIVLGAVVGLPLLTGGGLFVLGGLSSAVGGGSQEVEPLSVYENSRVSFEIPGQFEEIGFNITYINEYGEPYTDAQDWGAYLDDDTISSALIQYRLEATGIEEEAAHELLVDNIQAGLDYQSTRSLQELADSRAATGHGCVADFEFLTTPGIIDRDGIVGMQYEYFCTSKYGPVKASTMTFYDRYGSVHRMTVDAIEGYWDENSESLRQVISSVGENF